MLHTGSEIERAGCLNSGVEWKEIQVVVVGKEDGDGGFGVMVKEELCEKVVEVRIVCGRVMTVVVVFEEYVLRLI